MQFEVDEPFKYMFLEQGLQITDEASPYVAYFTSIQGSLNNCTYMLNHASLGKWECFQLNDLQCGNMYNMYDYKYTNAPKVKGDISSGTIVSS